jgi:hypothetical protein
VTRRPLSQPRVKSNSQTRHLRLPSDAGSCAGKTAFVRSRRGGDRGLLGRSRTGNLPRSVAPTPDLYADLPATGPAAYGRASRFHVSSEFGDPVG